MDTAAPVNYKNWKSKYVVIGGPVATPSMMKMYRTEDEYSISVLEASANRKGKIREREYRVDGAGSGAEMAIVFFSKLTPSPSPSPPPPFLSTHYLFNTQAA